jgi:hypothetical protein
MSAESEGITDERSTTEDRDTDVVDLRATEDEIRQERTEPASDATDAPATMTDDDDARDPLLSETSAGGYRERWEQIQARFVDDPKSSVEQADALVNEVIHELETSFGSERETLEAQWQRGEDVETENLRVVLRRYRSFFSRLLSA